jgi:hypothetical protein
MQCIENVVHVGINRCGAVFFDQFFAQGLIVFFFDSSLICRSSRSRTAPTLLFLHDFNLEALFESPFLSRA